MAETSTILLADSAVTARGVEPVAHQIALHAARALAHWSPLDYVRAARDGVGVVVRNHADGADYLVGFTVRRIEQPPGSDDA